MINNWPNFGFRHPRTLVSAVVAPGGSMGASEGATPDTFSGSGAVVVGGLGEAWSTTFGSVPLATDPVVVSAGTTVRLDGANVARTLDIQGTLIVPVNMSTSLTVGNITIGANGVMMTEGGATLPPQYTFVLTLNGVEAGRTARVVSGTTLGFTNDGVGRSLQVNAGGKLNLFGTSPTIKRTKLNASAAAGTNTFTLADSTGWKAGDEIVMGTTDFYGVSVPEKLTLQSNASGTSIQSTTTIASARWGALQYVTDAGMSLTAGTLTGAPVGTPTILDERAMVINLTRNIVIQGANDTAWTTSKFGAHCMFMGRTSDIKLDGVQFRRVGQAGAIGRYPIHWHMMSYNMPSGMNAPSDGTFLGAVVGSHYAKNCSVSESGQRMIVIHGTHGVTLDANVGFDITGHAIFLEDGAEQDNVITDNVVMKVRSPTSGNKLLNHDSPATVLGLGVNQTVGTAGIWNTNPKNTFTGNWINDSEGAGMWNSFAETCFGLSVNVAMSPYTFAFTLIDNNFAYGCNGAGALTNDRVYNDKGDTGQTPYAANFTGSPIKRMNLFKNAAGGYSNRITAGEYQAFTCADNAGMDVFGQATIDTSIMRNTLTIAESLNNATSRRVSSYRAAFATYHELLNFKDIIAVGYTYITGGLLYPTVSANGGGLFRIWDLYTQGFFTFSANSGFKLINCDAPFRTLPPYYDGYADNNRHWTLAGAIKDTSGIFGAAGKYWVYNLPFFTYSATSPTQITAGHADNGVVTTDRYFGTGNFTIDNDTTRFAPLNVSRQDSSGAEVGTWVVPDGATSTQLGIFRHFSPHNGGRYVVSYPGVTAPSYYDLEIIGMADTSDMFLLALPFSAGSVPRVWQEANGRYNRVADKTNLSNTAGAISQGYGRFLTSTGSLANVVADTSGTIFFRDTANNLVWMQVKLATLSNASIAVGHYGGDPFDIEYRSTTITLAV